MANEGNSKFLYSGDALANVRTPLDMSFVGGLEIAFRIRLVKHKERSYVFCSGMYILHINSLLNHSCSARGMKVCGSFRFKNDVDN